MMGLSQMYDCTVSGTGFRFSLFSPKQSPILSETELPRERSDKVFSVPFIPGVWFGWFSHQTLFHVIPSSPWAENLHRHKVLTVSHGKATIYLGLWVVFKWMKIKGAKTQITSSRATQKLKRKKHTFLWYYPGWRSSMHLGYYMIKHKYVCLCVLMCFGSGLEPL